ncbi:hypothetical protein HY008_02220 [Candidatus Woesebacteria bacterium]|nr:hypothetical protein [Candidatus Woesebacteria bacterium]
MSQTQEGEWIELESYLPCEPKGWTCNRGKLEGKCGLDDDGEPNGCYWALKCLRKKIGNVGYGKVTIRIARSGETIEASRPSARDITITKGSTYDDNNYSK